MNPFVNYIIEAGLSLGVFTLIYWFILRSETRFKATRFYLLFALLFSTMLPFLSIKVFTFTANNSIMADNSMAGTNLLEAVTVYATTLPARMGSALMTFDYSMMIYRLGAFAVFFVLVIGIFQLIQMASKNRVFKLKSARLVISPKAISPYSFFHYIFISKELTEQENWKTMVHHEVAHVKQGHSFDVLFIDFMMVFQWFNPFYWVLRRLVRENHEFLADTAVLSKGLISNGQYKKLLLSQAIGGRPVITSNFFNVKTVKKRFKMITNKNNRKYGFLKYSLGVAMAIALTLMFACEKTDSKLSVQEQAVIYIYDGQIATLNDVNDMNINYVEGFIADKLELLTVYPHLQDQLENGKYKLIFNLNDKSQVDIMSKLKLNQVEMKINNEHLMFASQPKIKNYSEGEVFVIVEDMPEFFGGELALRHFLANHLKYPEMSAKKGEQGRVYVTFIVDSDGFVKNARIARGISDDLDEEALRVVNALPQWKPGKQRGQNVAVSYTVPINFQLQ